MKLKITTKEKLLIQMIKLGEAFLINARELKAANEIINSEMGNGFYLADSAMGLGKKLKHQTFGEAVGEILKQKSEK